METWDAIRARRNVRSFSDRPLAAGDLDRILQAGWLAPSANNRQRRDLVVVSDRQQLAELATVWQHAGHVATSAVTVACVLPPAENERLGLLDHYDLGQATMAMMLAAADLGVGSGHASVGDQEACRRILGYPEDHQCQYLLAFGYPSDRPLAPLRRPDRRPFDEVVHRSRW